MCVFIMQSPVSHIQSINLALYPAGRWLHEFSFSTLAYLALFDIRGTFRLVGGSVFLRVAYLYVSVFLPFQGNGHLW